MSAERRGASPNKQSFNDRTQAGAFEWKGMAPDIEPQDLPPDRPSMLRNGRLMGGGIAARPGMTAGVNLGAEVTGMTDFQLGSGGAAGGPSLVFGGNASATGIIAAYDTEESPRGQGLIKYENVSYAASAPFGMFGDDLYFARPAHVGTGVTAALMRITPSRPPYGENTLSVASGRQAVKVWNLPTGYDKITAIKEFNGDLYVAIAIDATPASSQVYKFDGTTLTLEITGINPIHSMVVFRELLVAMHDGSSNLIRTRTTAGVWATVAPGAGTVSGMGNNAAVSYKDNLYIADNGTTINSELHVFNGTTLTRLATATTGISAVGQCMGLAVFDGYLYYLWQSNAGTSFARLGRFDGTTWTGTHKNLGTQFGATAFMNSGLAAYRGSLFCGILPAAGIPVLAQSPRATTSGTWTSEEVWQDIGASPGDTSVFEQFLVY